MTSEAAAKRPTTADIARLAGVSRATVSHILNDHRGKFSAETEEKVLGVLADLEYRPSFAGRLLKNGRSDIVIVVMPGATYGLRMQDALDEIVKRADELGLTVFTRMAGRDSRSTVDALLHVHPVAVMDIGGLEPGERERLSAAGVPVIPAESSTDAPGPDDLIGELQVEVLLRTPRDVVFATAKDERGASPSEQARHRAVERACARRGLPTPPTLTLALTTDSAAAALAAVGAGSRPVGVACYNDDVAMAIVAGARRLGRQVPDDVAVVGVDVTPLGQLADKPLTSISIDIAGAIDANLRALSRIVGRADPDADESRLTVRLHQGATA